MNIDTIIKLHRSNTPDKIALIGGQERLSYSELDQRINRLANALLKLGVRPGDKVSIMLYNGKEFWETSMALSRIGVAAIYIGYKLKEKEIEHIVNDSESSFIVFDGEFAPRIKAARKHFKRVKEDGYITVGHTGEQDFNSYERILAEASEQEPIVELRDSIGLIYTSGTTGKPKGAVRRFNEGTLEMLMHAIEEFGIRPDDIHLVICPLYHSAPLGFTLMTQFAGGTVCIMKKFDPEQTLATIEKERITSMVVVPTLLDALTNLPDAIKKRYDLSSMRAIICGAAPLYPKTKLATIKMFGEILYEYYGSTETGINLLMKPNDMRRKIRSCGRPFPLTELKILDTESNEVPDGQPGELYISAPGLMEGYYNLSEETKKRFRGRFMSVGDVAVRDSDGYYYIVDRVIDMVITGAINVYPLEVEEVIHSHPSVADVAVIGVPDDYWGEALKAIVALKDGAMTTEQELIDYCGERLADYKKPKSVVFVNEIPRSPQGKILKQVLREQYAGQQK